MSSRERASARVLAVSIAALVWIGAFGCMASPRAHDAAMLERLYRGMYQGISLKEFRDTFPAAAPAGHKVVDGVRIDAYVGHSFQRIDDEPVVLKKRWHYFYDDRLVSWRDDEDWSGAANDVIKWREQVKAAAVLRQQRIEAAEAKSAVRNAPMGDSW